MAWIYYAILSALMGVGTLTGDGLAGLIIATLLGLYARYLFRGGRFVLWVFSGSSVPELLGHTHVASVKAGPALGLVDEEIATENARRSSGLCARRSDSHDLYPVRQAFRTSTPEPTVSDFISQVESLGVAHFASTVLRNRMRTSSKNGVLKAHAALEYARVRHAYGIETIPQVLSHPKLTELELEISGVSTDSRQASPPTTS